MVNQDLQITFIHNVGMKFLVKRKLVLMTLKENEEEDNQEYLNSINKKIIMPVKKRLTEMQIKFL
jgi:hypothetical protein